MRQGLGIEVCDGVLLRRAGPEDAPPLWCIHGFGESGFSFAPLAETGLCESYHLVIPDLPGFGVSPPRPGTGTLDGQAQILATLIAALTPGRPVGLVGHSLGAPIAALIAGQVKQPVAGLFAIEGNLTAAGGYFTGRAAQHEDAGDFKGIFQADLKTRALGDTALTRYLASVTLADEESLWLLGRDATERARDDALGQLYRDLDCPSLFYWGEADTVAEDRTYLEAHGLPNRCFGKSGHWPMVDIPAETADAMAEFFETCGFGGAS